MKKVACILIEVEDNETVDDIVRKFRSTLGVTKVDVCKSKINDISWKEKLKITLAKLSINSYLEGYKYLFFAMEYIEKVGKNKRKRMKEIYNYVTECTGAKYSNIDRNILTISKKIYELNSDEKIEEVLHLANAEQSLPNAKFIAALADVLFDD